MNVRISTAFSEADLAAAVWPGVSTIYLPGVESADQVQRLEGLIQDLERTRGIRPGTVAIRPLIETPAGVTQARDVAASSERIQGFGPGPRLFVHLEVEPDADTLAYARSECELVARALDLQPVATEYMAD